MKEKILKIFKQYNFSQYISNCETIEDFKYVDFCKNFLGLLIHDGHEYKNDGCCPFNECLIFDFSDKDNWTFTIHDGDETYEQEITEDILKFMKKTYLIIENEKDFQQNKE